VFVDGAIVTIAVVGFAVGAALGAAVTPQDAKATLFAITALGSKSVTTPPLPTV
jgi:hypothetical protein